MVVNIRQSIVNYRRKSRLRQLLEDIRRVPDDATPLTNATKKKFESISRNVPKGWLSFCSKKSEAASHLQSVLKNDDIAAIKEAIEDWVSYSEDL